MAAPLTFAVEFATDAATNALKSLVSTVKSTTVDLAANILAPVSPQTLLTNIAQQGLGLNSLGANLVSGGLGALGRSSFGHLVTMGTEFNAEQAGLAAVHAQGRELVAHGLTPSAESRNWTHQMNYSVAKKQEEYSREVNETLGREIALRDMKRAELHGTLAAANAWNMGTTASLGALNSSGVSGVVDAWERITHSSIGRFLMPPPLKNLGY